MPSRQSEQDSEGVTWNTVPLRLGEYGLDLRRPSEPPALADLINARFLDERTLQRRDGFTGTGLVDGSSYPPGGNLVPGTWLYGHGQLVTGTSLAPNVHYPESFSGQSAFQLEGQTVAWTGDRLLIPRDGGNTCLGSSTFWQRVGDVINGSGSLPYGIPAHLPLATDVSAPASVHAAATAVVAGTAYVEACLTPTMRVYLLLSNNVVTATILDRETGGIVRSDVLTGTSTAPVEPTILSVSGMPTAMWRDTADGQLRVRQYTSGAWTSEDVLTTDVVAAYDAFTTATGWMVVWRTGGTIKYSAYTGLVNTTAGQALSPTADNPPNGQFAAQYSAIDSTIGLAYAAVDAVSGFPAVYFETFNLNGTSTTWLTELDPDVVSYRGMCVAARPLSDSTSSTTEWVIHVSATHAANAQSVSVFSLSSHYKPVSWPHGVSLASFTSVRANSDLQSRSFVVGDEVFCWLRSRTSSSCFLLCGALHPYVSGFADKEVGTVPTPNTGNYWPARVLADPAGTTGTLFTWTRAFNTNDIASEGNVLSGDMSFLPQLSTANYGKSTYLSGSCVKNWDGQTLADTGFCDYPTVGALPQSGGSLTVNGKYNWFARAVRYNAKGERFESLTQISAQETMGVGQQSALLTIQTAPGVSTNDVYLEIYRTQDQNTASDAYYLEGTILNDPATATLSFTSTMSDAALATQREDTHETGVGNAFQLETSSPLGCAYLATIGDRLWGAGGQVPAGVAQFSLLADQGAGAGFDDEAGYVVVSNEGGSITAISPGNGAVILFETDRIYAYADDGPDNQGNGGYSVPNLYMAAGATSHFGTVLTQQGVLYWSAGGPLLLTLGFQVLPINSSIRPLAETLSPSAVQVDTTLNEVVWYCGTQAILMNYMTGNPRWARWTTPDVVGGVGVLMTATGRVLTSDSSAYDDDGIPYGFTIRTGNVRADQLLEGHTEMERVGITGLHNGDHTLRLRFFYDGSAMWSQESIWEPEVGTWLASGNDFASMTPAQVDAAASIRSGAYGTNKRLKRQTCHYVSIEISDISSHNNTFTPFELSFEMAAKPGLGRTAVNTFNS